MICIEKQRNRLVKRPHMSPRAFVLWLICASAIVFWKSRSSAMGKGEERKEKNCLAVPAHVGSLAEAKMVPVTKPVRAGGLEQYIDS
eukprot:1158846-Pelagomonas_calceolata.AAC.5